MGKVNSITKLEIAIFVFLTMMISGASSIASNDFIRIIVVGLLALYSFINHKNLYNNILFYLLSGWILINLISSLYFGKNRSKNSKIQITNSKKTLILKLET